MYAKFLQHDPQPLHKWIVTCFLIFSDFTGILIYIILINQTVISTIVHREKGSIVHYENPGKGFDFIILATRIPYRHQIMDKITL